MTATTQQTWWDLVTSNLEAVAMAGGAAVLLLTAAVLTFARFGHHRYHEPVTTDLVSLR